MFHIYCMFGPINYSSQKRLNVLKHFGCDHLSIVYNSTSIKDFVREKKSTTEKRKSNRNFLLMKLNTKPREHDSMGGYR